VPEPASVPQIQATAAESQRQESTAVLWLLTLSGTLLVGGGWLLPWFVERTSGGTGFSGQDAVFTFTGPASLLLYVVGLALLAMVAGVVNDVVAGATGRGRPFLLARARAALAVLGALSTLLIWYLIGVKREEPLFGPLSSSAFTDNAVWLTLTGLLMCAFAYGLMPWVLRHGGLAFTAVAFAVGAAFPFIVNGSDNARDFVVWGAQSAGIYVLLALGLNVVVGFAGLLDLGYAAFFAIGAYTTASLASSAHGIHLPFWVLIFVGGAVAGLFGVILGAPTLRLRGDYLAIVTLGFGEIVPDMATNNAFGQTGGPNGLSGVDQPALPTHGHALYEFGLFGVNPRPYFYCLLLLIALVIVVLRNAERSRLGRAWVAIREDEIAASAMGINTVTTKLLAFAIGASVSGFAGAFFGAMLGTVTPENFSFAVSVTAISTVVLGGIGNITGATVGGILIAFVIFWVLPHLQEWGATLGHTTGITQLGTVDYSKYTFIVYGVILVSIMLLRPAGLLPSQARKVELSTGTESEPLAAVQGKA
jgi:branched-chain amino acid transport system permease protein